jgi:hypothetical protein
VTTSLLLSELKAILTDARSYGYDTKSQSSDVFEGYIWALILKAAREKGADIYYETVRHVATNNLLFRTAPGNIFSTTRPYTHAVIRFAGKPELELHVGIKVTGTSGVLHECDVAVLYREEAISCRSNEVHPRSSALIIAVECKYYASTLPLDLGRSFLGLAGEIHRQGRYFVTNSQSSSIVSLLNHHKLEWDVRVLPDKEEAGDLLESFRRLFRNYKVG